MCFLLRHLYKMYIWTEFRLRRRSHFIHLFLSFLPHSCLSCSLRFHQAMQRIRPPLCLTWYPLWGCDISLLSIRGFKSSQSIFDANIKILFWKRIKLVSGGVINLSYRKSAAAQRLTSLSGICLSLCPMTSLSPSSCNSWQHWLS